MKEKGVHLMLLLGLLFAFLLSDSEAIGANRWSDLEKIVNEERFLTDVKRRFDTLEAANLALKLEVKELSQYLSGLRQVHASIVDRVSLFEPDDNERSLAETYATIKYVNNIQRDFAAQSTSMQTELNQSSIELTQLENDVVNLEVILIPPFTRAPTNSPTTSPKSEPPSTWRPTRVPTPKPSPTFPPTAAPSASIPPTASPGKIHLIRGYPKVSFHNASGNEELVFKYRVIPYEDDSFYTAIVYQNDCVTLGDESVQATTDELENTDGYLTVKVDVDLETVSKSSFWSKTNPSTAELQFCLRIDYYLFEESINFLETNVTIYTDLRADFDLTTVNITSSGTERRRNSTVSFAPNIVQAFDCKSNFDGLSGDGPLLKGEELQLCFGVDATVSSEFSVKDIYSLGLSQEYEGGTHYANIIQGFKPDALTTKHCDAGRCSVQSRLTSKWFDGDVPKDIVATVEALLSSKNGTGSQLHTLVVNRSLAPAPPPVDDMHILWILIYVLVGVVGILIAGGFAAYFIRKRHKGVRLVVVASTVSVDPTQQASHTSTTKTLSRHGSSVSVSSQKSSGGHSSETETEGSRKTCDGSAESSSSESRNKLLTVETDANSGTSIQSDALLSDDEKKKAMKRLSLPGKPEQSRKMSRASTSKRRSSLDSELRNTDESDQQKHPTIRELAKKIESSRIKAASASVSKLSKIRQESKSTNDRKPEYDPAASNDGSRPRSNHNSQPSLKLPATNRTKQRQDKTLKGHEDKDTPSLPEQRDKLTYSEGKSPEDKHTSKNDNRSRKKKIQRERKESTKKDEGSTKKQKKAPNSTSRTSTSGNDENKPAVGKENSATS